MPSPELVQLSFAICHFPTFETSGLARSSSSATLLFLRPLSLFREPWAGSRLDDDQMNSQSRAETLNECDGPRVSCLEASGFGSSPCHDEKVAVSKKTAPSAKGESKIRHLPLVSQWDDCRPQR